jgi:N-acyl-D-amino-acid deacylase
MSSIHTLIKKVSVVDGSGADAETIDVAIGDERIVALGPGLELRAENVVDGEGLVLAPGFIDTHTHDDLCAIRSPQMLAKLSQGVTTAIVGNCGISAAPVQLRGELPDPMNLLGQLDEFRFPTFAAYKRALREAGPAVNVAALVGHTALRNNHMDRLDRGATSLEIEAMRAQLQEALDEGALGLSTGLAYGSAQAASSEEVLQLAQLLTAAGAVYATHMRNEAGQIRDAMSEAFEIGRRVGVPVILSHLKCAGIDNWGRGEEVLLALETARSAQPVGCDCYPYAASSSTLDLRQVDERVEIRITWSEAHPEEAGKTLAQIAHGWGVTQLEAAQRLQPAGAIYHSMSEADVRRILRHPATMIGSDGLPCDPLPHPRLWGTFPRVLGHYCREEKLFSLSDAVHKMTGMPAQRFGLAERGLIREGYFADLTLFDPRCIRDAATFSDPQQAAEGILGVWVNGVLAFDAQGPTGRRAGRFVTRDICGAATTFGRPVSERNVG